MAHKESASGGANDDVASLIRSMASLAVSPGPVPAVTDPKLFNVGAYKNGFTFTAYSTISMPFLRIYENWITYCYCRYGSADYKVKRLVAFLRHAICHVRFVETDPKDFYAVCSAVALQIVSAAFPRVYSKSQGGVDASSAPTPSTSKAAAKKGAKIAKTPIQTLMHAIFNLQISEAFGAAPKRGDLSVPAYFVDHPNMHLPLDDWFDAKWADKPNLRSTVSFGNVSAEFRKVLQYSLCEFYKTFRVKASKNKCESLEALYDELKDDAVIKDLREQIERTIQERARSSRSPGRARAPNMRAHTPASARGKSDATSATRRANATSPSSGNPASAPMEPAGNAKGTPSSAQNRNASSRVSAPKEPARDAKGAESSAKGQAPDAKGAGSSGAKDASGNADSRSERELHSRSYKRVETSTRVELSRTRSEDTSYASSDRWPRGQVPSGRGRDGFSSPRGRGGYDGPRGRGGGGGGGYAQSYGERKDVCFSWRDTGTCRRPNCTFYHGETSRGYDAVPAAYEDVNGYHQRTGRGFDRGYGGDTNYGGSGGYGGYASPEYGHGY